MTLDPENTVCIVKYNLHWICSSHDADCDRNPFHGYRIVYEHVRLGLRLMQKLKWLIG